MKVKNLLVLVLLSVFAFTGVNAQKQEVFANIQTILDKTNGMLRNETFGGSNWYMKNQKFSANNVESTATINGKTCYNSYSNMDWSGLSSFKFEVMSEDILSANLYFRKKINIKYFCDGKLDDESEWEKMTVYVRKKDKKKMEKYLNQLMGRDRS